MHISEGFLSPPLLTAGWAMAGVGLAWGLKKMEPDKIVRVAIASSAFFLASLVNVRIPPGSAHLSLIAPMGLLLGRSAFPAVFTALLLQAVLFQFGGLMVLGVNSVSMGAPALCVYLLFGRAVRSANAKTAAAAAFAAGVTGVLLGIAIVSAWLVLWDRNMLLSAETLFAAHLPVAVVEGIITLCTVSFLRKSFPDVLDGLNVERA
ncbi:cobalt transporter CbiM [Synergistales bacterium]|nr:cobalt transporter CbiM [Synergistales bacterium]GHV54879.1 cobalt transporter CbiM [Synergistales bacterium]